MMVATDQADLEEDFLKAGCDRLNLIVDCRLPQRVLLEPCCVVKAGKAHVQCMSGTCIHAGAHAYQLHRQTSLQHVHIVRCLRHTHSRQALLSLFGLRTARMRLRIVHLCDA